MSVGPPKKPDAIPGDLPPDDIPKDFKSGGSAPADAGFEVSQGGPPAASPQAGEAGFQVGPTSPAATPKPTVELTNPPPIESSLQDPPKPPIEGAVGGDDKDKDEAGEKGKVTTKDQAKPPNRKEQGELDMPTTSEAGDYAKATKQGSKALGVGFQNMWEGAKQFKNTMENNGGGPDGAKAAFKEMVGVSKGAKDLWNKVKNAVTGGKSDDPSTPEMKVESSAPAPTSSTGEDAKPAAADPKKDGPEPSPASDATEGPLANVNKEADDQSKSSSTLQDSMKPENPAPPGAGSTLVAKKKDEDAAAAKTKDKEPAPDTKPPVNPDMKVSGGGGSTLGM